MPQPDYQKLIDSSTWDFINQTSDFYPPDAINMTIAQQRAVYDQMCRAFHAGYPPGVTASDETHANIPCRTYTKGASPVTVVYFHGGGFVVGGLESHDDVCAEICAATGFRVIAVDYRLAPEHRHPAAYDDCLAATRAIAVACNTPLILVGDSAGGALAASVSHATRHSLPLLGQVLIYPGLGGDRGQGSYLTHAHAPMLSLADVLYYAQIRYDGPEPTTDPTAAVLHDSDFTALPPTTIISAECDPLADDGRSYRDKIRAAGGSADWHLEPGLVHGYLRARHTVPRAAASFARICAVIGQYGVGV